jgi:hypothetical protein
MCGKLIYGKVTCGPAFVVQRFPALPVGRYTQDRRFLFSSSCVWTVIALLLHRGVVPLLHVPLSPESRTSSAAKVRLPSLSKPTALATRRPQPPPGLPRRLGPDWRATSGSTTPASLVGIPGLLRLSLDREEGWARRAWREAWDCSGAHRGTEQNPVVLACGKCCAC